MSFDLDHIARRLYRLDRLLKRANEERETLRREFFMAAEIVGKPSVMPRITVKIPTDWFRRCHISESRFFETRYPSWRVIDKQTDRDDRISTWILEKVPDYLTYSYESHDQIKIAKQIQEYDPEFDWFTLQLDMPDLFKRLAKPKITYEMDTVQLEQVLAENPELLEQISRHLMSKKPVKKLGPIRKVEDE